MGMDIVGKKPSTQEGEYFRNNLWWWRPLWDYCANVAEDLIDDETYSGGHYNDGVGLDAEGATALAMRLIEEIQSGRTAEYEAKYRAELAELPMNDCEHCNATGIRTDKVGMEMGMHDKALDPEVAAVVGRTHGTCNGCRGYGKTENWATHYPFDVKNVEEFANFLMGSGGFAIY